MRGMIYLINSLLLVFCLSLFAGDQMLITSPARLYSMDGKRYRRLPQGARVRLIKRGSKWCYVEYQVIERGRTKILRGFVSTFRLRPVVSSESRISSESRGTLHHGESGAGINVTLALEQWGAIFKDIIGSHPPLVEKRFLKGWPIVGDLQRVPNSRSFAAAIDNGVRAKLQRLSVGSLLASGLFQGRRGLSSIRTYLGDRDPVRRAAAAVAIAYATDRDGVSKLLPLLDDSDVRVLCCAAISLKNLGSDQGVNPVAICYVGGSASSQGGGGLQRDIRIPSSALSETLRWLVPDWDQLRLKVLPDAEKLFQQQWLKKWRQQHPQGTMPPPHFVVTPVPAPFDPRYMRSGQLPRSGPRRAQAFHQQLKSEYIAKLRSSKYQQIADSVEALARLDSVNDVAWLYQRVVDGDKSAFQRLVNLRLEALPAALERAKESRGTLPMGLIKFLCSMSDEHAAREALLELLHSLPPIGKHPLSRSERRRLSDLYADVAHLYAQTGRRELFLAAIDLIEKRVFPLIGKELDRDRVENFLSEKVVIPYIISNASCDVLAELLQENISPITKLVALRALLALKSAAWLPLISRYCEDPALSLDFRLACAEIAARYGDPRAAVPALTGLKLGADYSQFCEEILEKLGEMVGVAWDKQASKYPNQWLAAVKNAADIRPVYQTKVTPYIVQTRFSFDVMLRALKNQSLSDNGREKLLQWFSFLPDARATEVLAQAAVNLRSPKEREKTVQALAARRSPNAISAVVKLMEAQEKDVRSTAAGALKNLPRIPADAYIMEYLARWVQTLKSSQDKQTLETITHSISLAVQILSKHGNWKAVPLLIEAMINMKSNRGVITSALSQMTGVKIGDFPEFWFEFWLKCKGRYPALESLHQFSAPASQPSSVAKWQTTNPAGLDELLRALNR